MPKVDITEVRPVHTSSMCVKFFFCLDYESTSPSMHHCRLRCSRGIFVIEKDDSLRWFVLFQIYIYLNIFMEKQIT
jgi:hypothetical protein